jgi:streptomycin 6-kinase
MKDAALPHLQDNPVFVTNMQQLYPQTGHPWLRDLPTHLNQLAQEWNFEFVRTLPDLSYSYVALVKYADNHAILKMAPTEHSLEQQTHCLSCFQKKAPTIFHFHTKLNAVLMEHINPGHSLKNTVKAGQDDAATQIICGVIRELRFQTKPTREFKHLSELGRELAILTGQIDKPLLDKATALFHDLSQDRTNDILLHGDLHHDNILSADNGWKVIDPHGYIGDPAAEVATMIRNPMDCFPSERSLKHTLERRLSILKDELPYDPKRMNAWAFCINVLSAAWTYEGFNKVNPSELLLIDALNHACF